MTYDWFKSQFTAADLNGKSVAFRVPLEQGGIASGEGQFKAAQDARGYIRAAIIYAQMSADMSHVTASQVYIPVEESAKIARNPPGSKCEFSFIAA